MDGISQEDSFTSEHYRRLTHVLPVGRGKESQPEDNDAWVAAMLPWHYRGDPLAEAVAGTLREEGGMAKPAERVRQLAEQGDVPCQRLLADMEVVPEWVDFALMRCGGAMAQRHFPQLILALTYGCLPLTFAHPDAAAIFVGTGRMEANISRRLNESAALFFGVCDSDALAPGKAMWEACLHVRLVHALVRMKCLQSGWDLKGRGMPVSQLATAAGPAFFGTHLLDGMRRLGARVSDEEAAGHCMIWRYTTRLMGVPLELLGSTQQEQDRFDASMMSQFFAPDDTAKTIMASLLDGLCTLPPTSRLPRAVQIALFRRMLGDEMADAFGVPVSGKGEKALSMMLPVFSGYAWLQRVPGASAGLRYIGQQILDRYASEGLVSPAAAGTAN